MSKHTATLAAEHVPGLDTTPDCPSCSGPLAVISGDGFDAYWACDACDWDECAEAEVKTYGPPKCGNCGGDMSLDFVTNATYCPRSECRSTHLLPPPGVPLP